MWGNGIFSQIKVINKIFNEVSRSCKYFELPETEPMMDKKFGTAVSLLTRYVVEQRDT